MLTLHIIVFFILEKVHCRVFFNNSAYVNATLNFKRTFTLYTIIR